MKTLPYDLSRCSGVIKYTVSRDAGGWPVHEYCEERESCQRWLAFSQWDRQAGIDGFANIPVPMAVDDCGHKIELE